MMQTKDDEANEINEIAKSIGLTHPVYFSPEVSDLLKPNSFLTELGIKYTDRINTILSILKGNLIPGDSVVKETMPKRGIVISLPITKGPYIKEELVYIKAELLDDDGTAEILLTANLGTE